MKNVLLAITFFLIASNCNAQKHVDLYRSGTFFKSYSTIDSAIKAAYSFGDSLVLSAHTFYESKLDASTKIIQYQGTISAGDTTIIDGGGKYESLLKAGRSGAIKDIIFQNSTLRAIECASALPTDTFIICGNSIIRNINPTLLGSYIIHARQIRIIDNVKIINNNPLGYLISCRYIELKNNSTIENNHIRGSILDKIGIINNPVEGFHISGKVKIINNTTDSNITAGVCILNRAGDFSIFIGDSVIIKNNRVLTPGIGKGGAIYFGNTNVAGPTTGLKSFKIGAAIFEGNEADQGGAIYCEDSSIKLEFNGTIFRGNKAKKGGAIYSRGSIDIKNANFENNIADTGTSIYINTALDGGSTTPFISATGTRFFNSTMPAIKQNHIYATYTPLTAIPPSVSFDGNWWGKSDTVGVMIDKPKGTFTINNWAKANWSIKNGIAVVKSDTVFPVAAAIRYSSGSTFPANSFTMLKGTFTVDTGKFTPTVANINSSNVVSSSYKTFKDSSSKSANADIVAWIDADTFRKTQIIWSIDTLPNVGSIAHKNSLPKVFVFPNPASDFINIQGLEIGTSIELYDFSGKLVKNEKLKNGFGATLVSSTYAQPDKAVLDVKNLSTGTYLLKITSKEGAVGTAKVMKD